MGISLTEITNLINAQVVLGSESSVTLSSFTDVTSHSQKVSEYTIFVAIKGTRHDGHSYLPDVSSQTKVIVIEDENFIPPSYDGLVLKVSSTKSALATLANYYYSPKLEQMIFYGVTGTNGKTSSTYILESLLAYLNQDVGVLGTNNHRLGDKIWPSQLTTPDPVTLHKRLSEMQSLGASSIAMEVSSHALDQSRIDGLLFDVAIFTNLSLDHLDYHDNLEDYFLAKKKLFVHRLKENSISIVNGDDKYADKITASAAKKYSFGQEDHNDFCFSIENESFVGCNVELCYQSKTYNFLSPLVGRHNVYNIVGVIVALYSQGYDINIILQAIKKIPGIPGRLEPVVNSFGYNIFIDYAHTDDALRQILVVLNQVKKNLGLNSRVITVFGCGGDRDKSKRPLMFAAATKGSDIVIVTSDNPRTENPSSIIDEIISNNKADESQLFIEVDRATAIKTAVKLCRKNDILVVAGKGHEDYQIIGDTKYPFSDHKIIGEALDGL